MSVGVKRNKWKIKALRHAVYDKKDKKKIKHSVSDSEPGVLADKVDSDNKVDEGNIRRVVNGRVMKLKIKRLDEDDLFYKYKQKKSRQANKQKSKQTGGTTRPQLKLMNKTDNTIPQRKSLNMEDPSSVTDLDCEDNLTGNILLEVCVDNFQSVVNAAKGGAKRLELCSSLSEGGLTPTHGLLKMAKAHVNIPVFTMIRPRGGDFVYNAQEVEIMKMDILHFKELGADGFVFGILDKRGYVDESKCKILLKAADPFPCTFHRAFDLVADPLDALKNIINLGFSRLLTSGQQTSAFKGIPFIRQLVQSSGSQITIMAGAGVNANNVAQIVTETRVSEIHGSARVKILSTMQIDNATTNSVTMGSPGIDDSCHYVTDSKIVTEIIKNATTPTQSN